MSKIRLITESSCDLNKEIANMYNITVIPQNITLNGETYLDGDLDLSKFYDIMSKSKELPKTSCPSPDKFKTSYEECEEDEIIVFTIASKLSGTYSAASLGKQIYEEEVDSKKRIEIIDSECGSIGQCLLILLAARMIEEGKSFDEIVEELNEKKKEVVFYGALETLDNAIKGGRVNPIAGKIINALNFKAIIQIGDSQVKPIDKARGDNNSIKKVVDKILDAVGDDNNKILFIAHADSPLKADKVKEMLTKDKSYKNIYTTTIGAVMGTYTSKGAVLVAVL